MVHHYVECITIADNFSLENIVYSNKPSPCKYRKEQNSIHLETYKNKASDLDIMCTLAYKMCVLGDIEFKWIFKVCRFWMCTHRKVVGRAAERWERWERVPSQFEILTAILADDLRTFVAK